MKMIRALLGLALLLSAGTAAAMEAASVPTRFPIWWGTSAGASYIRNIPEASQIGIQNCGASLTDGFPPLTFTPPAAGGCPPFGQDMNGILRQLSQWSRWQSAGAAVTWDSSFSSSVGGYPAGASVAASGAAGCSWISTVDNNASDPNTGGSNWIASCPAGGVGGTSGGAANLQTVTASPFVLARGAKLTFVAGFANTGSLQVNANGGGNVAVFRKTQLGASAMVGGEVAAGQLVVLEHDGTQWQCASCAVARVGEVIDFAIQSGTTAPDGYLFIDGSCQSQASLPVLSAVLGTTYGNCGAGTFRLPDGRGAVTAGPDNQGTAGAAGRLTAGGSGCAGTTLGTLCGGQNVTIAQTNIPAYNLNASGLTVTGTAAPVTSQTILTASLTTVQTGSGVTNVPNQSSLTANFIVTGTAGGPISSGGGNTPLRTVQSTLIIPKLIKF